MSGTTYRFFRNRRHPAFRLVLRGDGPFPAETTADDWDLTRERHQDDVNPDVLADIEARGYALFSLGAEFSQIPRP